MIYTVVCHNCRGGDVIEHPAVRSVEAYTDLKEAVEAWARWYRPGPNGPLRDAEFYVDGVLASPWRVIEEAGMTPLVKNSMNTRAERLVSCQ